MKTLAERLVWARNKMEMSQERLADLAGVSQSTIGNLEAGIRLSARKLPQIANALGVNALWLAEGIGEAILTAGSKQQATEEAAPPEQVLELLTLFYKTGKDGRSYVINAARTAAEEDPLTTTTSANKFQLR